MESGLLLFVEVIKRKVTNYILFPAIAFLVVLLTACEREQTPWDSESDPLEKGDTSKALTGMVTDIDGNAYRTVVIGTQTWMAENLRTTRFNDGTIIPNVPDGTQWAFLITPGYCWYGNNETDNKKDFGALYNWHAVNSGKLAPAGWHVPTQEEWTVLINYLGGEEKAGGTMKEAGLDYWNSPNADATNASGFSARAGGGRYGFCSGSHDIMERGYWWTATPADKDHAYSYFLDTLTGAVDNTDNIHNYMIFGYSVRCVKDN